MRERSVQYERPLTFLNWRQLSNVTYVYDRSKTFFLIIVFSTVLFSSRKLVFLLNLEVSTHNGMGDILKFELLESYDMLIEK